MKDRLWWSWTKDWVVWWFRKPMCHNFVFMWFTGSKANVWEKLTKASMFNWCELNSFLQLIDIPLFTKMPILVFEYFMKEIIVNLQIISVKFVNFQFAYHGEDPITYTFHSINCFSLFVSGCWSWLVWGQVWKFFCLWWSWLCPDQQWLVWASKSRPTPILGTQGM